MRGATTFSTRYAQQVYHFRWLIIIFWLTILLACIPLAGRVNSLLHSCGYTLHGSESDQVDQLLSNRNYQLASPVVLFFQSVTMPISDPAYQRQIASVMQRARSFEHVTIVTMGDVGKDLRSTFLLVAFDIKKDAVAPLIPAFQDWLTPWERGPALIYLTGSAVLDYEIPLSIEDGVRLAEQVSLGLVLVVLLFVFGTALAALLPIILAGSVVCIAYASVYGIAHGIEMDITTTHLISLVGLGLSIDYSLLLLRRFREELTRKLTPQIALAITLATAGKAILQSGIIVMVGFTGLLLIDVPAMRSFGIGGSVVTGVSLCIALTLLPAIFSVLGRRVNAWPLPRLFSSRRALLSPSGHSAAPFFWQRLALFVMKHPVAIILLVLSTLLVAGWPGLSFKPDLSATSLLAASSPARRGLSLLDEQIPLMNSHALYVLVQTSDGRNILNASDLKRIDAISRRLTTLPGVTSVVSLMRPPQLPGITVPASHRLLSLYSTGRYQALPTFHRLVDFTTKRDTSVIIVAVDPALDSLAKQTLLIRIRSMRPDVKQYTRIFVGGIQASSIDFSHALYEHFIQAFLCIILLSYLFLLLMFRSLLLPLKAILMNILSISTAYGALVFIFQEGHFEHLLGFASPGFIDSFVPIVTFFLLFGLSMDYEIFLLTRIYEEWLRTQDNGQAVALGLEKTGKTVTQAALLLITVSTSFLLFTRLIMTKELGLSITISILVDATLVRCLLVPATMQLLGRWNWWLPINTVSKGVPGQYEQSKQYTRQATNHRKH